MTDSVDDLHMRFVAFHEAGHAVVAQFFGCDVSRVSIGRDRPARTARGYVQPMYPWDPASSIVAAIHSAFALSGPAADYLVSRRGNWVRYCAAPGQDIANVRDPARHRGVDADGVLALLANGVYSALLVLRHEWAAVERLADELMRAHSLDGEEARRIIGDALRDTRRTQPPPVASRAWPVPLTDRSTTGRVCCTCACSRTAGIDAPRAQRQDPTPAGDETGARLQVLALRLSSYAAWADLGLSLSRDCQHARAVVAHRAAILLGLEEPQVWGDLVIDLIEMTLQGHGEDGYAKAIEAGPLDPGFGPLLTAALGDRAVPMPEGEEHRE